jgi:hypothetical protein
MDNVTINSLAISSLRANRDATNSNVTVSRSIGNMLIGGSVTGTNVNVGESQSLFADVAFPGSLTTSPFGAFYGSPPPIITNHLTNPATGVVEPFAQSGGSLTARIAGNVNSSIFSASYDTYPTTLAQSQIPGGSLSVLNHAQFGADTNAILPRGLINAKIQGSIDNSTNPLVDTTVVPITKALFAQIVHRKTGPVIPPTVPYEPYKAPTTYHKGQSALHALIKVDHYPSIIRRDRLGVRKK